LIAYSVERIAYRKRKAFTLIETILVMIILGISLTPFSILVINVMQQNAYSQAHATAVSLAEKELERVTNLRFNDHAGGGDVNGVVCESTTAFGAPFASYSYQVAADYVNVADLNTSVGRPANCPASGSTTNYERVQVIVTNTIAGSVTLTSLIANDW